MRAAAVAAVLTLMAVFTGTAQAAGYEKDGFEILWAERWDRIQSGTALAGFDEDRDVAYKGENNGWLRAANSGWAAERRRFEVSGWGASCRAKIWANPLGWANQVELQVWVPNPSGPWTMIATQAPWLQANSYQQFVTPVNLSGRGTVYVQAIFSTRGAEQYVRIDEAELECD